MKLTLILSLVFLERFDNVLHTCKNVPTLEKRISTTKQSLQNDDDCCYICRVVPLNLFLACTWCHEILKSKIKELPKFLFSSGKEVPVLYLLTIFQLNSMLRLETSSFWISELWWCVTNLWSCLAKINNYLGVFWPFEQ